MGSFSDNLINQRFRKVFEALDKYNIIKGKSDIAKQLGTYNHVVNSILKGDRNITVDQLQRLFEIYGVNANFVFGLSDNMFVNGRPAHGNLPTRLLEEQQLGGRRNITLVPERAMAGYALDYQDRSFMDSLQKFSIPGLEGSLVGFEINGDSMSPTITNGDVIVCQEVERGEPLRDNHVYVIVTDVVVAKRIQQVREGHVMVKIRLISDNGDVYKPYEVELEDIRQILKVKCRLTSYAIS